MTKRIIGHYEWKLRFLPLMDRDNTLRGLSVNMSDMGPMWHTYRE